MDHQTVISLENQHLSRRLLLGVMAGLWILGCLHPLAMGQDIRHVAPSLTFGDEEKQVAVDTVSPLATSPSFSMGKVDGRGHDTDALVVGKGWVWVASCLLLTTVAVIAWLARMLWRSRQGASASSTNDCQVRQIAERISDVFWVGTADYSRLEYVNKAYETVWGRSCESLYAEPLSWTVSLFPHDRQAIMDTITHQQASDSTAGAFPEFRIVGSDGSIRWIHARTFDLTPLNDGQRRIITIFQDITRHKFFEASLRESDGKWRSLTENSPDYIMLADLDGHIFFANRGFMGFDTAKLVGKSLQRLIAPKYKPAMEACLKTVVESARSDTCQVESSTGADPPLIFELRMGPVTVNDQIVAIAVNSTEITSRVEQEKALKESEAFHRTLFNDAPTGMCIQDFSAVETFARQMADQGEGKLKPYLMAHPDEVSRLAEQVVIVKANQAMVDLYQVSSEKMILGPLSRVLKTSDREHFVDQVVTLASGEDCYIGEARNLDFKGRTLHLILRTVVVQRSENGLSKVLTSLVDVTPIKTAEKERELLMLQLQQAQKMEAIGTLAGGVAHDFNNILGIILGNVDLAVTDMPKDYPAFHNLQEIERAVSRARDIVKQLLGISRKSEQALTFMHLVPVVEEAVTFLRATIPANIHIETSLAVDNDVICADSTQIHQVMINLCTNASHAMQARGGRLSIRLDNVTLTDILPGAVHPIASGSYIRLTVSDTGTGISDEIRGRIFDPYFTTKASGKGTGMGLCMVQGIMENSGGGIVLETSPGKGTTFALYFPLTTMPADEAPETELEIPSGSERILFVDDETLIVELSVELLKRLGYQVTSCTAAPQALSLFEADPSAFDLVVTDMAMPELTGCQLIERIRKARPTLPVILCSGNIDHVSETEIEALAIDRVLAKPVSLKELAVAVRRTLDSRRQFD